MKKEIPTQLFVGLAILLIGGALLGIEFFWVKLAPMHKQHVADETLKLLPYSNQNLGIDMQVAAGIYGKVETFPGGAKIYRPQFWGTGPALTITSAPNIDHATELSQESLAKWETDGVLKQIARYHFEHTQLAGRDAVLLRQYTGRDMLLTAHVISPDHIIVADCSTGSGEPDLMVEACDESLRSLKVAGPEPTKPELEPVGNPGFTPPRALPHK